MYIGRSKTLLYFSRVQYTACAIYSYCLWEKSRLRFLRVAKEFPICFLMFLDCLFRLLVTRITDTFGNKEYRSKYVFKGTRAAALRKLQRNVPRFPLSSTSYIQVNTEYRLGTHWWPLDWLCCCASVTAWSRLCICKQLRRFRGLFPEWVSRGFRSAGRTHVLLSCDLASDSLDLGCPFLSCRSCNKN